VGGGLEITGVLELSVLLQPTPAHKSTSIRTALFCVLCGPLRSLRSINLFNAENTEGRRERRENISIILIAIILGLFLGKWFTGDSILTLNPSTEVDKLTPFRTEGTKGIFFPLDPRATGWTFHEC
jgi:hypothetical protein